ncbi:MAG: serine hydrolase [Vampirovibrionales bacterium]
MTYSRSAASHHRAKQHPELALPAWSSPAAASALPHARQEATQEGTLVLQPTPIKPLHGTRIGQVQTSVNDAITPRSLAQQRRQKQRQQEVMLLRAGLLLLTCLFMVALSVWGVLQVWQWSQSSLGQLPALTTQAWTQLSAPWLAPAPLPNSTNVSTKPEQGSLASIPTGIEANRLQLQPAQRALAPLWLAPSAELWSSGLQQEALIAQHPLSQTDRSFKLVSSATLATDETLQYRLNALAQQAAPTLGLKVAVVYPKRGVRASIDAFSPIASASVIKLPLLYVYAQHINSDRWHFQDIWHFEERQRVSGSGDWQFKIQQPVLSLRALQDMIQKSDNSATELVVERLGGRDRVNQQWEALGFQSTRYRNQLPDLEGMNRINMQEMVDSLIALDQHPSLRPEVRQVLQAVLEGTHNRRLLPALLPPSTVVVHKTGDIGTSLGEAARITLPDGSPVYIAVMVSRPHNHGAAKPLIQQLGLTVYNHYAY